MVAVGRSPSSLPYRFADRRPGARLVIDEEKAAGKLPAAFRSQDIFIDAFVRAAADSVNSRFGDGCE
jgi:hypothetical protein